MAKTVDRDWLDIVAKLMIPLVIALGGALYTWHKDAVDEKQRQWERDSGYIRLLASSNDQERNLGLKIIEVLQSEGQFSEDLKPVVKAVAATRRPSDPSAQTANLILSKVPASSEAAAAQTGAKQNAAPEVYIVIGHEEQRERAVELQTALRQKGYLTPDIQVVAHPTFHTYVRYFANANQARAEEIKKMMLELNFAASVQDFTDTSTPTADALEVWFGDKEPAQVARAQQ